MTVWVVTAIIGSRRVAMEVAADTSEEVLLAVRADQYSSGATNIKILGELKRPRVLRWLPGIPNKQWINYRNQPPPKVFVFDGDDTLWYVEWKYSQAYADFFSYLYRAIRNYVPNIHFIYKTFCAVEERNASRFGIRRERVAESMVETYRQICAWVKNLQNKDIYDKTHEYRIRAIGDQPFDVRECQWIPGAEEALQDLQDRGHTLCLLTKYDRETWPEKADILRASRFFRPECIRVVEKRKELQDFASLAVAASATGDRAIYTVGNSEGDMLPVTSDERWYGFYIPLPSSVPLEHDTKPLDESFAPTPYNHSRVITLRSITELSQYFSRN